MAYSLVVVVLALVLFLAIFAAVICVAIYNGLVTLRNRMRNAWSQIDVQLKRRHDLIPNLVETAKGYLAHERQTLEAVIAARSGAVRASQAAVDKPGDPAAVREVVAAEATLGGALGRLFALSEAYPQLQANETMRQLSEELTSTENRISFARQAYNDAVMTYNTGCERFPAVLLAGSLGFFPAEMWRLDEQAQRAAPVISFT